MSDRIAVFAGGRIQQIGRPDTTYETPANAFVAGFVGENNMLAGTVVTRHDDQCAIRLPGGQIVRAMATGEMMAGEPLIAAIRRSEEHTSALQSLMRHSYAVLLLHKKKKQIIPKQCN